MRNAGHPCRNHDTRNESQERDTNGKKKPAKLGQRALHWQEARDGNDHKYKAKPAPLQLAMTPPSTITDTATLPTHTSTNTGTEFVLRMWNRSDEMIIASEAHAHHGVYAHERIGACKHRALAIKQTQEHTQTDTTLGRDAHRSLFTTTMPSETHDPPRQ